MPETDCGHPAFASHALCHATRPPARRASDDTVAMHTIRTEIRIAAPIDVVWAVLTDFPRYGRWNPFIRAVEGRATVGARLTLMSRGGGAALRRSQHVLVRVQPRSELTWQRRFGWGGLTHSLRHFRIDATPDGGVRLRHSRQAGGLLSALAGLQSDADDARRMQEMNLALKDRAERAARAGSEPRSAAEEAERADRKTRLDNALSWR